jgi:hypothetical protein
MSIRTCTRAAPRGTGRRFTARPGFSYLLYMKLFAAIFGIAAMTVLAVPGFSQNAGQAVSLV